MEGDTSAGKVYTGWAQHGGVLECGVCVETPGTCAAFGVGGMCRRGTLMWGCWVLGGGGGSCFLCVVFVSCVLCMSCVLFFAAYCVFAVFLSCVLWRCVVGVVMQRWCGSGKCRNPPTTHTSPLPHPLSFSPHHQPPHTPKPHLHHTPIATPQGKRPDDWKPPEALRGSLWSLRANMFRAALWGWDAGWTPGMLVRTLGPWGKRLVRCDVVWCD